ncbi:hypothetical protein NQZ79_g7018 [Umbelopsis isabellina]|nr:hypothetical protein NQZ79_g7018 [Umbelopsis isabellina]
MPATVTMDPSDFRTPVPPNVFQPALLVTNIGLVRSKPRVYPCVKQESCCKCIQCTALQQPEKEVLKYYKLNKRNRHDRRESGMVSD